jgi:hypothetical protein
MKQDEMFIYRKVLKLKYFSVVCFSELSTKPKNSTWFQSPQRRYFIHLTLTYCAWYHSVDTKHDFIYVKFKVRFATSLTRKYISNGNWHFSRSILFQKSGVEKKSSASDRIFCPSFISLLSPLVNTFFCLPLSLSLLHDDKGTDERNSFLLTSCSSLAYHY